MRRATLVATVVALIAATSFAGTLQIVPTTTLAAETGSNTSAPALFAGTSNGNAAPANVSKVDIHTLLYPGFSGKIYAHLMAWFCMTPGSTATGPGTQCGSHVQIGYTSSDPAVVHAQVTDMMSRGFDGIIHDWYGPGNSRDDVETRNLFLEAEQHPGFEVALMIDQGSLKWYSSCYMAGTCTATQALTQIAQYAAKNFFNSPAYMRINGRPVLTNFDIDLHYSVDWNYVAANTPGNPIFIFQNNGGFSHALSSGSYAWIMPTDSNYGLDYLGSFYATGMKYPSELTVGAMYKGFNDTLASWSGNRIMSQQCGQTWLQTFAKANSIYNSSNQLGAVQLVTWDDYEEGTELESGIDNCLTVSGSTSGNMLTWTIGGSESTVDHYTVFISSDGQNLMPLGDFPVGTRQLDLAQYSPVAGATYKLFVKAIGKPSIRNQMSGAVMFTSGAGVRMNSPNSGATLTSPVTVSADAMSSLPISAMVVYLDYQEVYRTTSNSVNTSLAMNSGSHLLVINAWDSAGTLMQAKATINVVAQGPVVSLSLSSTAGVAPATITASTVSSDPNAGGSIASSTINWGDGSSSAGPTAAHTYTTAGTYTVTATVTDSYGLRASANQTVTITAPSITISAPSPGAILASPARLQASAVSGLPISAIIVYLDNTEVYRTLTASVDTNITMPPGQHRLTTNAWDKAGTLMQAAVTITAASGPTAVLSLDTTSGVAPVMVQASTAASSDAQATITSSTINWGDGTTSTGPTASHSYGVAGRYSVTATVSDSLGLSSTSAPQAVVVQPATLTITSPANGATVSSPIPVSATAVWGQSIATMTVYLDGVSVYSTPGASVKMGIAAAPGTHTITVKATDSAATTLQSSVALTVLEQPITASLAISVSPTSPVTVTASTAGSMDPNLGATLTSTIYWGDGSSSAGPSATHTYGTAGPFKITATVSDNYGAIASATRQVIIQPGMPVAALSTGVAGLTATASTAGSTDPNLGATLVSRINWGDGTSSTGTTATHTYAMAGMYTITATVTDSYGVSASAAQSVTAAGVAIWLPAPGATASSPVHLKATAFDSRKIAAMKVYVDNTAVYQVNVNSVDTWLKMNRGSHRIVINAWEDVTGKLFQSSVTVTVP